MGFPKTIPTIPVPYKLRKKGLFETIDNIDHPDTSCITGTRNITDNISITATTTTTTTTTTPTTPTTTDVSDINDVTDIHNVSDTDDTYITDNLITLSLIWLTISTIIYIYIKY
jgi:hypothetical protein